MTDEKELLLEAIGIIERIVIDIVPCTCHEAYTSRGLTAPDCVRCNGPDFDEAENWLAKYYERDWKVIDCRRNAQGQP